MIPEIGQFSLSLALIIAILQAIYGFIGAAKGCSLFMRLSANLSAAQLLCVASAFGCLVYSFAINDFSVMNVADHSSRTLPLEYRLTAAWGSHEGSFLLWTTLLSAWGFAVRCLTRQLPSELVARILAVMGSLSTCFLTFILFTSNPFMRLHPAPGNGADLNPLLQDPGMIIHPPLLYMGYVGFSVAFAFAVAALLSGRLDSTWARWVRPWTLAAWSFLTLGIMVGSWWAYYELGWGGWWFWDPSENASLMPWLAGTALVHSLIVTGQRDTLRVWTILLALVTFSLSLVGTFLVRSGVLSSVHAFAQDPLRGLFILIFLCVVIGGSLLLFALRANKIKHTAGIDLLSRETALLLGNVILLVVMMTVLLGTLYPLLLDAFGFGKISVGPPYFNAVVVPLMIPVILLMGATPLFDWGRISTSRLFNQLKQPALIAMLAGILFPWLFGEWQWPAALGITLACWVILLTAKGLRARRQACGALPLRSWGMAVAHTGLAISLIGMGLVSAYHSESTAAMRPGDKTRLGQYDFVFQGANEIPADNYSAMRGEVVVLKEGYRHTTLWPEKRMYRSSRMIMTEAAIHPGWQGDLYVALGDPLPNGGWSLQMYLKPFVGWLWSGALLMALGGLIAACAPHSKQFNHGEKK